VRLVGGTRRFLDLLEAECPGSLPKRRDVLVRVRPQVHAGPLGAENRAVVDVGEVHHLAHAVPQQVLQRAAQDVDAHKGPEVADVAASVHGEAAGVHTDRVAHRGGERLLAPREGVVQAHHVIGAIPGCYGIGQDARQISRPAAETVTSQARRRTRNSTSKPAPSSAPGASTASSRSRTSAARSAAQPMWRSSAAATASTTRLNSSRPATRMRNTNGVRGTRANPTARAG